MTRRFFRLSIGTRIFISTGTLYILAAITIVVLINHQMRHKGVSRAESKARILLDQKPAAHGGIFDAPGPVRPGLTRSGESLDSAPLPSTRSARGMEQYFKLFGDMAHYCRETGVDARTPENRADDLERAFLEALDRNPELKTRSFVRREAGTPWFVALERGKVKEERCFRCHGAPGDTFGEAGEYYGPVRNIHRKNGEVIPVISVRVPLTEAYEDANRLSLQLAGALLLLFIGISVAHFWLNRRFVILPLSNIRAKALQVSTSTRHLGEELPVPSGRELADLTTAFNTMSRGLSRSRSKLEERVKERTADLTRANERLEKELMERKRMERSLQEYSVRLEDMVRERSEKLKETQEKLVRREKLAVLGQLAGGVAHDLRTPLGVIKNASYFLDMVLTDCEADVKEMLELLNKEVRKANSIINSLLDFARPRPPALKQVRINEILEEVLSTPGLLDGSNVTIQRLLDEKVPTIMNDPDQLLRVFDNLIKNAVQAMPEGGTLTVKSEKVDSRWLAVSVNDTGTGISEENLTKIFEPLVTTKGYGIGLGLVVTKTLVEGNGGTIHVESREGHGSTFTVRLPVLR